ncbi:NB-ARC domain, LRR domain containing protein [Parasponia andersonii]|uniref:NB-ARC domain, LRR domain containing protein n=1 Tax=Parasponia andersonii TaxID=3476 RepID=A0A2P5AQM9_PARAD|nr:NB-ARC domain, LRR domain containing protein [Parasponia andersonii]
MATEIAAEAFLSASIEFLLDKIASSPVADFLRREKYSSFDVLKLETLFYSLTAVLADAGQKQIRNPAVKRWLERLQDAVDDAEDLFDEIEYEALKLEVEAESRARKRKASEFLSNISNLFYSTDLDMKTKMEEILGRLEYFANQINILGLEKGFGEEKSFRRIESTSLMDESEVYGRNADKDAVMKVLMTDDVDSQNPCVIPIVGMGGVGKTTLAQALFNDHKVKEVFEHKVWVCVSDEFDVCKVTETILRTVSSEACNGMNLNLLQVKLREKLTEKKFFIVLDDVWEDNYVKWEDLKKPFKDGAQGSTIIITTRSKNVARIMGTVGPHFLNTLTNGECWQLFAKHACSGFTGDFTVNSELKRIGRDIVEKCKGLPLAAKALGGLLRSTLDVGRWEQIAKSDIWDFTDEQSNILPALRLSYHYLPSHLKRCFAYCSIFPKNYEFQKEELVLLWMALKLVEHSERNNRRMEEVGEKYFDDLVSMSFFQQLRTNENTSYFVMHDLMVDLARSVSGKYFCLLSYQNRSPEEVVMRTRHLACSIEWHDLDDKRFSYVLEATRLRTFLSLKIQWDRLSFSKEVVDSLLSKLQCLRVVTFCSSSISELPDSIGEQKHLRYLDLSSTTIRMLPKSITTLYNLQTLKLYHCRYLENLPKDMHHLINLRHLDIRLCNELLEMPGQISKLKDLQILSIFIVGKDSGSKIGELRELSGLRGELHIKKLENVVDVKNAPDQANLKDKKRLEKLSLQWSFNSRSSNDGLIHEKNVLDMLLPHRTLKELEIFGYPGKTFPSWVGDISYGNIVFLKLIGCRYCFCLPPLGQLPFLKTLIISEFDVVATVGNEFYGNGSSIKPFSSLEILTFNDMSSWKQWEPIRVEDAGTFGKLRELKISNCHKLTGELPQLFPSLTKIKIYGCERFAYSLPRIPCIRQLEIRSYEKGLFGYVFQSRRDRGVTNSSLITTGRFDKLQIFDRNKSLESPSPNHRLESLEELEVDKCDDSFRFFHMDFFPKLRELSIYRCKSFESLSISDGRQCLASLSSLCIMHCPNFVSFPEAGLPAPNLSTFRIEGCDELKWLPRQMHNLLTSLKTLEIKGCPEIDGFPEGGLPLSLSTLTISSGLSLKAKYLYSNKLMVSWSNWNLQRLINLKSLTIESEDEDVESFPEEGRLPTTITHLSISKFRKLRALDKNGLQQLTSLKELMIGDCHELQTIPEEVFSTSLERLTITYCPKLRIIPVQGLPSLEALHIYECPNLQTIQQEFPASLKELDISGCPMLGECKI